jgi:hypothetical protein
MFLSPHTADIIYVNRGLYKHYGIYAGDNVVIHFAPLSGAEINAQNAVVHETTLQEFLKGGELKIDKQTKRKFSKNIVVSRARSLIGTKGYGMILNNCEHFARWCACGIVQSKQVDNAIDIISTGIDYGLDLLNDTRNINKEQKLIDKLANFLQ